MRFLLGVIAIVCVGCGNQLDVTTAPISIDLGSASDSTPLPAMPGVPSPGFRNVGTEVWVVPPPAGDVMRLAQNPELWPIAQRRTDVVSLYWVSAYHHEGFECGLPCGPNTYPALMAAVPGGMFKWISDRFTLALQGYSIKEYSCTEETLRTQAIEPIVLAINNIKRGGARLTYLALDEPFAAGVTRGARVEFGTTGCDLSVDEVARLQKIYNDGIHAVHPEVRIGLIEPYSGFSADEHISFIEALERAGVRLAFFQLDFDQPAVTRNDDHWKEDIRRIREFCRSRGIPFSVILWGWDGRSDGQFSVGYWSTARMVLQSVGVTEQTVLQSWAEGELANVNSLKNAPATVPETIPTTVTGLLLDTLEFFSIKAR